MRVIYYLDTIWIMVDDLTVKQKQSKHGTEGRDRMRLIDADALKKEFPKDTDWEYPVNTNEYVCEMIDSQPTIKPQRAKEK